MKADRLSMALILVALVLTAAVYPFVPEIVPRHWNIHGEPDAWSHRSSVFGMVGVTAALFGLFSLLPRLDRSGALAARPGVYVTLVRGFVVFFLAIHAGTVAAALGHPLRMGRLAGVLVGLLLIYTGNHLPQVKPNLFVGIRTPWTLADEATWRATHRIGGYVTMGAGAVLALLSLTALPDVWILLSVPAFVVLLMALSLAYSRALYRSRRG